MRQIFCLIAMVLLIQLETQGQSFVKEITSGTWDGSGKLMGSEASFKMKWSHILDGQFLMLEFQNKRTTSNGDIVFNARGIYKISGESTVEGTWFDSRGISFPLEGKLENDLMTIDWGSKETEQGRTEYRLLSSGQIKVTDYILQNGNHLQFGEATYEKN